MSTLSDLITKVLRELSMVDGPSVQQYSEDQVAQKLQQHFNHWFDQEWWDQFMSWQTWTLDGTTGQVTADVSSLLKRHQDIKHIYPGSDDRTLPRWSDQRNPANMASGTTPEFWEPVNTSTKRFRVLPITSTGTITARIRTKPTDFGDSDTVDFDDDLLVYSVTADYAQDDGTNQEQVDKYKEMTQARFMDLKAEQNSVEVALNPLTHGRIPSEWY